MTPFFSAPGSTPSKYSEQMIFEARPSALAVALTDDALNTFISGWFRKSFGPLIPKWCISLPTQSARCRFRETLLHLMHRAWFLIVSMESMGRKSVRIWQTGHHPNFDFKTLPGRMIRKRLRSFIENPLDYFCNLEKSREVFLLKSIHGAPSSKERLNDGLLF